MAQTQFSPWPQPASAISSQHAVSENRVQVWHVEPPFTAGVGYQDAAGLIAAVENRDYPVPSWFPWDPYGSYSQTHQVLSPGSAYLATASLDGEIIIYDHLNGEVLHTFTADTHVDNVWLLAWHPDNRRLASAGEDGIVSLWDIQTGEALYTLAAHEGVVHGVGFSADGDRLITNSAGDGMIKIWDANSGELHMILPEETNLAGFPVVFSPDGNYLAGSLMDGLGVWDLATGEMRRFTGHTGMVQFTAFDPSGQRVASCSHDGTIRIWDLKTGTELLKLERNGWGELRFSPDGKLLALDQSINETVHILVLDLELLIKMAEARITRSLTDQECRQYLHLEGCP